MYSGILCLSFGEEWSRHHCGVVGFTHLTIEFWLHNRKGHWVVDTAQRPGLLNNSIGDRNNYNGSTQTVKSLCAWLIQLGSIKNNTQRD